MLAIGRKQADAIAGVLQPLPEVRNRQRIDAAEINNGNDALKSRQVTFREHVVRRLVSASRVLHALRRCQMPANFRAGPDRTQQNLVDG
jgi:hypothetical protein